MILLREIKRLLANSENNSAYRIECIEKDYSAWVVRFDNTFGVAIPYNGKPVSEEFAKVSLYSGQLIFNDKKIDSLFLISAEESYRNEFAMFCRDFVIPGDNGLNRRSIQADPVSWWKRWKYLIGNAVMEKKPYAILGELVVYSYLLEQGVNVKWKGPESASHDLTSDGVDFEVKSTLSRYEKIIHITGQFQMQKPDIRLFLYFCRFEENINGISLNDMVGKLVYKNHISEEELNKKLKKMGYGPGNSAREDKYQLHEIIKYEVDDQFPRIVPEMFPDGVLPVGITRVEYDVDLSVLSGASVKVDENEA